MSDSEDDDDHGSDTSSRFKVGNSIDQPSDEMNAETLYKDSESDSMPPHIEKALDLVIWCIPFSFLYLMLDIMIHQQYAQHPTALEELGRAAANIPSE